MAHLFPFDFIGLHSTIRPAKGGCYGFIYQQSGI